MRLQTLQRRNPRHSADLASCFQVGRPAYTHGVGSHRSEPLLDVKVMLLSVGSYWYCPAGSTFLSPNLPCVLSFREGHGPGSAVPKGLFQAPAALPTWPQPLRPPCRLFREEQHLPAWEVPPWSAPLLAAASKCCWVAGCLHHTGS